MIARHADEEDYEGMEEDDEGGEGTAQVTAASSGPQDDDASGHAGAEPLLETVPEAQETMDEVQEPQMPDMAKRRCARHSDSAVAIAWSPQQPQVVVSGGCDDHAYLWRVDQEGMLLLSSF